ncbi:hypothetical protein KDW77_gp53 [Mycobacterium phage Pinnie]|uniref:Uncharacterized protein n=1 Tax=Mycobacterium phage Pinnie TaxID=2517965 RepID=A0A482J8J8_9CAUD|nr:hypothetical protein KDW77_gp53 [Mycobacterium phage Pinnie]QBP30267.1 hypothetical protein SEA_PINNIE_53 [Mycobacterium phage Pinnie]
MAAVRLPGQPWRVTCDLCEQTRLELDGDLSVDALGEAIREAGWIMPVYGGTFERSCYNRMRLLTGQPPIPEPDPVADLLATVTKVRNTLFHALGIEPDRRPQLAPQLPAGWRAECDDCPGVREPDYGALVYPHAEHPNTDRGRWDAERWAIDHRTANPGHSPTVCRFERFALAVTDMNPEVWRRLFER